MDSGCLNLIQTAYFFKNFYRKIRNTSQLPLPPTKIPIHLIIFIFFNFNYLIKRFRAKNAQKQKIPKRCIQIFDKILKTHKYFQPKFRNSQRQHPTYPNPQNPNQKISEIKKTTIILHPHILLYKLKLIPMPQPTQPPNITSPTKLLKIKQQIIKTKEILSRILTKGSYDIVCKDYRSLCKSIMYFLRIFDTLLDDQSRSLIFQCFVIVDCMVEASQFRKFGHRFGLFKFVIRRYRESSFSKFLAATTENILKRTSKNQQSKMFQQLQLLQISTQQMKFLQNSPINLPVLDQTQNQILIQNNPCVGCSEIFFKDFYIKNLNPQFSPIIGLNAKKGFDNSTLAKYVSAICNTGGGGMIMIGAQITQGLLKASGIKFKNQQEVSQKLSLIHQILTNISPPCNYKVSSVLVRPNFIALSQTEEQLMMRHLIRISVSPREVNKISYIEHFVKGYASVYEAYRFGDGDQLVKLGDQNQGITDELYLYMHRRYRQKKEKINVHQGINCVKPLSEHDGFFQYQETKQQNTQPKVFHQEKNQKQEELKDEPKFKYQNTCLIAVSGKKYDRQIINFVKALKKNKVAVQSSKPFPNSFKNCSRIIQVLSFQIQFQNLKKLLLQYHQQGLVKADLVTLMPVQKVLQIDLNKLSAYNQKKLQTKFIQRFNQPFRTQTSQVEDKNKNLKTILYMLTNQFSQSIFIYVACEELGLRPYFVKESSVIYQLQKY